jgi:acylphosphatase
MQATRFRSLVGTMTPPDDTEEAEIYVEGKRRQVEGFVRWCVRSDVGLSQVIRVQEVLDEDATGLYDDFYVRTQ